MEETEIELVELGPTIEKPSPIEALQTRRMLGLTIGLLALVCATTPEELLVRAGLFVGILFLLAIVAFVFGIIAKIHHGKFHFLSLFNAFALLSCVMFAIHMVTWPFDLSLVTRGIDPRKIGYVLTPFFLVFWIAIWRLILKGAKRGWTIGMGLVFTLTVLAIAGGVNLGVSKFADGYVSYLPTGLPFSAFDNSISYEELAKKIRQDQNVALEEVRTLKKARSDEVIVDAAGEKFDPLKDLDRKDAKVWRHPDYAFIHASSVADKTKPSKDVILYFPYNEPLDHAIDFWKPISEFTGRSILIFEGIKERVEMRPVLEKASVTLAEFAKSEPHIDLDRVVAAGYAVGGSAAHAFAYYYPEHTNAVLADGGQMISAIENTVLGSSDAPRFVALISGKTEYNRAPMQQDMLRLRRLGWKVKWLDHEGAHVLASAELFTEAIHWLDEQMNAPPEMATAEPNAVH
jgi:hypothetical protein